MTEQALSGDLNGRVIIVTGGAQGIGAAVARHLADWGAAGVVLCDRDAAGGEAVRASIEASGCHALFVPAELSDAAQTQAVIAETDRVFGRVDGLVNAAASTDRGGLLDSTVEFWDRMFAINVRAPFLLMQGAARIMRREGIPGAIVNILSVNAHCGLPSLAPYSASKGALLTLTRNTANALRQDRIRVNGINLGWTETPAEHVVQERESPLGALWLADAQRRMPFGRLIQPGEVADLVAFLLSDHSGVMTGAIIDYEQAVTGAPPMG